MLSSPPPVRGLHELLRGGVEVARSATIAQDRRVVDHRRQAVGAEQEDVAVLRLDGEDVDVDVGIGSERARDHRALRVDSASSGDSLPPRTSSATSEWSSVSCSSCPSRTRYARESPTWPIETLPSSTTATVIVVPMPGDARVLARALVDAPVRLADQLDDARLAARRSFAVDARPQPAASRGRDLAGPRAAHAVGDREQRRRADEGVLVPAPLAAGVADACRSRRASSLEPEVGLADADDVAGREPPRPVEPDAVDEGAVRRADVLDPDAVAARLEARVARGRELVAASAMSFAPPRPTVSARVELEDSPSSSAGLFTTTSRPRLRRPPREQRPRPRARHRIIDSCGRRTSFAAARTIRQMKR